MCPILFIKGRGEKAGKAETYDTCHRKRCPARRWVVERTNSRHNRFRKLFTRYEKKAENYLGLVQLSCCIIIYRKMILGRLSNSKDNTASSGASPRSISMPSLPPSAM